jgi:hypothetical protein
MALITGSWGNTTLVCGNHPTPPTMELEIVGKALVYVCPKCSALHRLPNEEACPNKLSAVEYEKMLTHIAKMLAEADARDEVPNLRNYRWRRNSIEFKILEHDGPKMTVSVLDRACVPQP